MEILHFALGDLLEMKKPHPCGARVMRVMRVGSDMRVVCTGCGREVMLPRAKIEKNIKKVVKPAQQAE